MKLNHFLNKESAWICGEEVVSLPLPIKNSLDACQGIKICINDFIIDHLKSKKGTSK